jgi:DNA-binding NarL/FixJ family response regulator
MKCIVNGAKAFAYLIDGIPEFKKGLKEICAKHEYTSPLVQHRFDIRDTYPEPSRPLTEYEVYIIDLIYNGFNDKKIAKELGIAKRTLYSHKTTIFTNLCLTDDREVFKFAKLMDNQEKEKLIFYPRDIAINPLPKKKYAKRFTMQMELPEEKNIHGGMKK